MSRELGAIQTLLIVAAALSLHGCVISVDSDWSDWSDWSDDEGWKSRQTKNADRIANLDIGKNESQIRTELGVPDFHESFIRGGDTFVILYYRTRHTDSDGDTSKDETTPLVFVDGSLVGWGDSAVKNATGAPD